MSPYFDCVEDITIEDQLMDIFIDQLHQFAEVDEEESLAAWSWSSSSVE